MMRFFLLLCLSFSLKVAASTELCPDTTVPFAMRDGTVLPTDLYFPPHGDPKQCPCLLVRSPGGTKNPYVKPYLSFAAAGYVIALQPTRSSLDPEGKTFPYMADGWLEQQDGYDTVEALAQSPYCNGKIGTIGASALGITQHMLAPTAPPHLLCQYISIAAPSLYHHALFPYGQILKNQAEGWLSLYASDSGVLHYITHQHFYNPFWKQCNALEQAEKIQTPAIHYGGWYDIFLEGTVEAFLARQYRGGERARGKQHLVIGPWTHHFYTSNELGDFQIPPQGKAPPIDFSPVRLFDHYLKDMDNGVDREPAIVYYVMGPLDGSPSSGNVWKSADSWPIPATAAPFYLHHDGRLDQEKQQEPGQASFVYDPSNPVPTIGGNNLFLPAGPKDQRPIEQREDVLVFTTPFLEEDFEIIGNVEGMFYFTTDQKDTDLAVRLCDVYPDGRSILLSDACYRLDVMQYPYEQKSQGGTIPVVCHLALSPISQVFAKGHRIRLSVTSSNYPRYEKNRNLGLMDSFREEAKLAKNTLYFDGNTPSQLLFPVAEQRLR